MRCFRLGAAQTSLATQNEIYDTSHAWVVWTQSPCEPSRAARCPLALCAHLVKVIDKVHEPLATTPGALLGCLVVHVGGRHLQEQLKLHQGELPKQVYRGNYALVGNNCTSECRA